jgi:uncharacterized membrane protein
MRLFRIDHEVRSRIWIVPLLCLFAGVGLAVVLLAIDSAHDHRLVSQSLTGKPGGVQTILTVAATALITLTSVVLTLTLVAIQLAMGQFSPRIVRTILHDRRSQLAIGVLVGTWAYTLTVLREVDAKSGGGGTVPGLPVVVDYALILGAAITLVLFVHHVSLGMRPGALIGIVGDETRKEIDRAYPRQPPAPPDPSVIVSSSHGVVVKVHRRALVSIASKAGCVLEMVPAMGDFVPLGTPLFRLHGELPADQRRKVEAGVILGRERTHETDPPYGLRKLVDIAERSVYSSPWQDPSTSVQAINAIHDCLRRLAPRQFPSGRHRDSAGEVRLIERTLSWEGYVRLAFDEIRLAGAGSPLIARRLRAALLDLKSVAPPERQAPLDRQLALLEVAVRRAYEDEDDVRAALTPDLLGIGSGPDVEKRATQNGEPVKAARRA